MISNLGAGWAVWVSSRLGGQVQGQDCRSPSQGLSGRLAVCPREWGRHGADLLLSARLLVGTVSVLLMPLFSQTSKQAWQERVTGPRSQGLWIWLAGPKALTPHLPTPALAELHPGPRDSGSSSSWKCIFSDFPKTFPEVYSPCG